MAWFALAPFIIVLFNSSSSEGMVYGVGVGLLSNLISTIFVKSSDKIQYPKKLFFKLYQENA